MRPQSVRFLLLSVCLLFGFTAAGAQAAPILYQHPTVDATQIVFSYAGNLWSVSREGGVAYRITAGSRQDTTPVFSPDGKLLAFTGNDNGNQDV